MKNLNKIILSLGTNLGKREINLKDCLGELSKISNIEKVSSIYESEPLIYEEQNDFENAKIYFDKCLEMSGFDYERGIHQKAKAGKERINY